MDPARNGYFFHMRAILAAFLLIVCPLLPFLQDAPSDICTKFNKCKESATQEKIECPACGKSKISSDFARCSRCATKEKVCSRCGLPKTAAPRKIGTGKIEDAVKSIEPKNIREYLTYYSSDELEGRCAGYPGNEKAIHYIRDNLKKWGLKPGNKGEWFQPFKIQDRETRNVVAVIEGSDLKDQYVVAGAHCDHVGKEGQANERSRKKNNSAPDDKIWNGADDNGSGTCTMLEIARAIAEGGMKPKRTIVFVWFNAEEFGLVGANHYADNPVYPLDKTVAMINMDMVGRNPESPYSVGCSGNLDQWKALIDKANQGVDCPVRVGAGKGDRTDQGAFVAKGLASAGFFGGMHPDYHCQSDHVDKIDFNKASKAAKLGTRMIWELANTPTPPAK